VPGVRANLGIGFANPALIPVNLGWHPTSDLWVAQILNVLPNVETYNKKKVLNGSVGYPSYIPELAVTYFPIPKLEVSLDARVDVNTKNHDTAYYSSNDFVPDYVAGYNPFPSLPDLQEAVNGYIFKQFSDDSLAGQRVGVGNRAQTFAVGPLIRYDIGQDGLLLKWQHELAVHNLPQGNRFWFQFAIPS